MSISERGVYRGTEIPPHVVLVLKRYLSSINDTLGKRAEMHTNACKRRFIDTHVYILLALSLS